MSRVFECDGCGERLVRDYIGLERSGHLTTGLGRGLHLGGSFHFCTYGCVESWARLLKLGPKA